MLFQTNLMNIIKNSSDPSPPMESAAIHLDQFDMILGEFNKEIRFFVKHDIVFF